MYGILYAVNWIHCQLSYSAQMSLLCTRMVTEINGHRDKRSSEIMAQKRLTGLINNTKQTKCYSMHCLSIRCYLVCAILLFTLFKFERFEDHLSSGPPV